MACNVNSKEVCDPNPHGLTFPYPELGGEIRPRGQGCLVCVHRTYCPAVYWFNRYTQEQVTENMGRNCQSWSDDEVDKVTTVSQNDLDENKYIYDQGIGSEANRNGITSPVTGSEGYF